MNKTANYKRVNFTLPQTTISLIDKISQKGGKSRLIDVAIRFYAQKISEEKIKQSLKEAGDVRGIRDLSIAEEWFSLDAEL